LAHSITDECLTTSLKLFTSPNVYVRALPCKAMSQNRDKTYCNFTLVLAKTAG